MDFTKEDREAFQEWLKGLETRARDPKLHAKWKTYTLKNAHFRQYPGWGHWNHDRLLLYFKRYSEAGKILKDTALVLDFGCGAGYGAEILSKYVNFIIGIDIDEQAIAYAKDFHGTNRNVAFTTQPIYEKFLRGIAYSGIINIDGIVAIESVEHVAEIPRLVKRFHELLAVNGKLIMSTPNMCVANIGSFESKLMLNDFEDLLNQYFTDLQILTSNPPNWNQKEPLSYYFIGTKKNE